MTQEDTPRTPPPEPLTAAGKSLADWLTAMRRKQYLGVPMPSVVLAIEAEAVALDRERTRETPPEPDLEGLRRIVERASRMGLCSQTHHEHLMIAARAALHPVSGPEPR